MSGFTSTVPSPLDARSVALVGLSYALVACLWWVNRRRGRARQDDKP